MKQQSLFSVRQSEVAAELNKCCHVVTHFDETKCLFQENQNPTILVFWHHQAAVVLLELFQRWTIKLQSGFLSVFIITNYSGWAPTASSECMCFKRSACEVAGCKRSFTQQWVKSADAKNGNRNGILRTTSCFQRCHFTSRPVKKAELESQWKNKMQRSCIH